MSPGGTYFSLHVDEIRVCHSMREGVSIDVNAVAATDAHPLLAAFLTLWFEIRTPKYCEVANGASINRILGRARRLCTNHEKMRVAYGML